MIMADQTFDVVIDSVTRLNNSVNGNPTYLLHTVGGATFRTQSDSSVSYEINNSQWLGVPVRISTTKALRVFAIEKIK
jgi:hypothetical protein